MAERRAGAKGRRLGSSRRRQLRELPPQPDAEQTVPDFMEREHRGFGPRAGLQELQPEGFLGSVEELQVVLAGAGTDGTGNLVDQEFPDGLPGQVLGSHERRMLGTASPGEQPAPDGTAAEEQEHFSAFMEQLGTDGILEDRELWELWVTLRQNQPQLLGNLEHFLATMRRRIQEAKSKREALEALLNQRVAEHGREVQQLCEALEQQMHWEMQQLQQENEARSLQQGMELWRALDERESQVQQLLSAQTELETRCRSLRRSRDAAGTEKRRLEQSNRLLQERLQRIRLQLRDTQGRLRAARAAAAPTAGAGPAEQPGATLPSPQTSPGPEKHRSEMRIRLGSQSDDRPPKRSHHVVWEKAAAEITVPAHPRRASSVEEDPFPEMLEVERISEQSSLLREMSEAIAALSEEPRPPGPAGTRPLGLLEDVTLCGPQGPESPHRDSLHTGAAPGAYGAGDEVAAGASERGWSPGAAGQGPEDVLKTALGQGQAERMGREEQTGREEVEGSRGAAGESVEAAEEAQAEEAEGAGHPEGQSGSSSGQGLREDEELGFIPSEPGSQDTQQGGSPAPREQPPGEVDGPRLGLQEGTAAAAAAVRPASPLPAASATGSPTPRELLPGAAPGLETEAEEGEAKEGETEEGEANEEEAELWPQRVPSPASPQGAEGSGDEVAQGEAACGAPGRGEWALPREPEPDPCVMWEEGAGTATSAAQEAGNAWGSEGQSGRAGVRGLAGAEEPTLTLDAGAGAQAWPEREATGFPQGQPARGAPWLPGEAEEAALPQEGDSGADAALAAPREPEPEAVAGLLRGAAGAGREAAAEQTGSGDAPGVDATPSAEAQSTVPAAWPHELGAPAGARAQEGARRESDEATARPPDGAVQGEGALGTWQPRDEAEQAEAAEGGMEDAALPPPEAWAPVAMQEEGARAAGRADEAEGAGCHEGQSGSTSGQGLAEDEEPGFILSEPGSRDTQQGGSPAPREQPPGEDDGPALGLREGTAAAAAAVRPASPFPAATPAGSPAPRELLPGAAPGLEMEAEQGKAEEGEANEEEAEPWPRGEPVPMSPQGAEGSGAEVPQGEAVRGALGWGKWELLREPEPDPCGMREEGAGAAAQEAGNAQGSEGQSGRAGAQGLAGGKEPVLTPDAGAGAQAWLEREAAGFPLGQPAWGAPRLPGEAEKAVLPQEGDSGADAGLAAPRELEPEAVAGLLCGAAGAEPETAAEWAGSGDAPGVDVTPSAEAQSAGPAARPHELGAPAGARAQEGARGESEEAAARPPNGAAHGEGAPGARQPRDEAEQVEAEWGGMEDASPQQPEARPLIAMQEEGAGAAGRADKAEGAGHPEAQSGSTSGQGLAEDEESGFIPSEPVSRDTQQGGSPAPREQPPGEDDGSRLELQEGTAAAAAAVRPASPFPAATPAGSPAPRELLPGAAPGLETEAEQGEAEEREANEEKAEQRKAKEGEANEEQAEPWLRGDLVPMSPQGAEGSGAEALQGEAAHGALGWGKWELLCKPEPDPCGMQEEGAGAAASAAQEAGNAWGSEGQSGSSSGQGLAEHEEPGFIPSEPGSRNTPQGGSLVPREQPPGEDDGPALGLQEGTAAAAAAVRPASPSPAATPVGNPAPRELLPGAAPGLETEAKEGEANEEEAEKGEAEEGEANEEEAEPWPQGVPIPTSPQGAKGSGAEALQGEAARGVLGRDEWVLPCEPEPDPCGMREEGVGAVVQEARNARGSEGQSGGAGAQGLAGAEEPAFTPGDSADTGPGSLDTAWPREGAPGHVAALEAHVAPTGDVPTRGRQPWDEAAPGAETPDVGASQGAFAGGVGQIPEESRVLQLTQGEGAGVCSLPEEGTQKPGDLQAKMVQPEVLTQAWGALDGEETQGRSANLEVSPLKTPKADATQGARAGAGAGVLEEPKEAMQSIESALTLLNTHGGETLQGEGPDAAGRPLHRAHNLDKQGADREAGEQVWGQPEGLQLRQGSGAGAASPVSLLSPGRRQAALMQEDVLVPDVPPLGVSGQEQVPPRADKVRPDVAPEQLLPKEKLLRVMEAEQAAAGPPNEEVTPGSALWLSVQHENNMGSNPMGTLGDSALRDTANSGPQPSAQLATEQGNARDVAHGMVSGQRDGKQDELEASQEAKPRPGAVLVHGAGPTPRGSPEACPDPDHLYNVLFVGDSHVGKTSFLYRLHADSFNPHLTATVGLDYQIKNLIVDNKLFTLRLWDSAGQERYHSITKQFFRKADGVVLMYDITSEYSFADVRYWLSCIQEGAEDGVTVLLLGNKTDCAAERRVPTAEGERLAQEHQLTFYECSAASGHNVSESMVSLIRLLKMREDQLKAKVEEEPKPARKKWGCC